MSAPDSFDLMAGAIYRAARRLVQPGVTHGDGVRLVMVMIEAGDLIAADVIDPAGRFLRVELIQAAGPGELRRELLSGARMR